MAQVTVTDPARDYLAQLIEKQDVEVLGELQGGSGASQGFLALEKAQK